MTFKDSNGFTVEAELPLNELLNPEWAPGDRFYDECIHVVPAFPSNKIHVYRMIDGIDDREIGEPIRRVKTTIDNVTFDVSNPGRNRELTGEIYSWCFQSGDGETILTWLTALKSERSNTSIHIDYMETNNSQLNDDSGLNNETFIIKYTTTTGRRNAVKIDNQWTVDTHKNANFE